MRTQVFTYKGILGVQTSLKAEGLLNDPKDKSQLGWVFNAKHIDIQPEALQVLKRIKRDSGDLGEIDIFETENRDVIFAWVGGKKRIFDPDNITGSSTYDPDLIKRTVAFKTPKDFVKYVDEHYPGAK